MILGFLSILKNCQASSKFEAVNSTLLLLFYQADESHRTVVSNRTPAKIKDNCVDVLGQTGVRAAPSKSQENMLSGSCFLCDASIPVEDSEYS